MPLSITGDGDVPNPFGDIWAVVVSPPRVASIPLLSACALCGGLPGSNTSHTFADASVGWLCMSCEYRCIYCDGCSLLVRPNDGRLGVFDGGEVCDTCTARGDYVTCAECDYACPVGSVVDSLCPSCTEEAAHVDEDEDDDEDEDREARCSCCCVQCCAQRVQMAYRNNDVHPSRFLTGQLGRWVDGDVNVAEAVAAVPQYSNAGEIMPWSYRPSPLNFHGDGPVYLGWELELCARNPFRAARHVGSVLGDVVFLKEDSSISQGFELVTHPMSWTWARETFPWDAWEPMVKEAGIGSDSTCGLHVHVSRSGFSGACHDQRWLLFWYRNQEQMTRMARRQSDQWARFRADQRRHVVAIAKKTVTGPCGACYQCTTGRRDECAYISHPSRFERYSAINVRNADTYEVRVFASSTSPQVIQGALGLVDSTVEYTRQLDANRILRANGWEWSSYVEWLSGRPEYAIVLDEINRLISPVS